MATRGCYPWLPWLPVLDDGPAAVSVDLAEGGERVARVERPQRVRRVAAASRRPHVIAVCNTEIG